MKDFFESLFSEFMGTAILMVIGVSAIILNLGTDLMVPYFPSEFERIGLVAIMFAAAVVLVIYSPVGKISGAHINPAVSFAFFLSKKLSLVKFIFYSLFQILGSIAGSALAILIWNSGVERVNGGMTLPGAGVTPLMAFGIEIVITYSIVLIILAMSAYKSLHKIIGLVAGFWVAILVVATAPLSGTSINPARSIGPAVIMNNYQHLWVYLTAPMIGAFLAVESIKLFCLSPLCAKLNHPKEKHACGMICSYYKKK